MYPGPYLKSLFRRLWVLKYGEGGTGARRSVTIKPMVFVLDNYDSFTYNLVQYMGELGAEVVVRRNDEITPEEVVAMAPDRILLSPGPCTPQEAGILIPLIQHLANSGRRSKFPRWASASAIRPSAQPSAVTSSARRISCTARPAKSTHDGRTIFRDMPAPMTCTRYHSLIVAEKTPCRTSSKSPPGSRVKEPSWALRHRTLPIEGVQFHPESVLTDHGKQLIANFLKQ